MSFVEPSVERRSLRRFEQRTVGEPGKSVWNIISDSLFYLVVLVAVGVFVYYLYTFQRDRGVLTLYFPVLLDGARVTLIVSILSMVLATIFGFIGSLGRLSRFAPTRWLATVYVEVVRGTPILVQLLLWYYGVGYVLSTIGFDPYSIVFQAMTVLQSNSLVPDQFNAYFYGIIALSFNYGAYLTEVFRTGIESVSKGQTEAALSLGLNSRQTMRHIVLPQAFRITIPPFTNYFMTLVQDSALLATISVLDLNFQTFQIAFPQTNANVKMFVFILGAMIYFVICYALALLARFLEARLARAY